MDWLRNSIGLRAHGQPDPFIETRKGVRKGRKGVSS